MKAIPLPRLAVSHDRVDLKSRRRWARRSLAVLLVMVSIAAVLRLAAPADAASRQYIGIGTTADGQGYVAAATTGESYAFGTVRYRGNPSNHTGIRAVAVTADGQGYIEASATGQVYAYGTVRYWGNANTGNRIVGVSVTADGSGYALISNTGEVYAFGSVRYWGNPTGFTGGIVGISVTANGQGYAAISGIGQVYAYGTVRSWGNPTGTTGFVGISVTADGGGYGAINSAGQVYAFGSVRYWGNPTGFSGGIVGISVTANGQGYAAVSGIGQVYAYGTVRYWGNGDPGSPTGNDLRSRIVANATAELHHPERNAEGANNCNWYSGQVGSGSACGRAGWLAEAWCADFARWIWGQSGARTTGLGGLAASFSKYETWRSAKDFPGLSGVAVGDVIGYRFGGSTDNDHVGIVVAVTSSTVTTVDGNNSSGAVKQETPLSRTNADISGYASPKV